MTTADNPMSTSERWKRLCKRIARWLSPELAFEADRGFRLWLNVDDVHKWCDGEARAAAQWLLEGHSNYARPLGEPPYGTLPGDISGFREWLRRERKTASTPSPSTSSDEGGR